MGKIMCACLRGCGRADCMGFAMARQHATQQLHQKPRYDLQLKKKLRAGGLEGQSLLSHLNAIGRSAFTLHFPVFMLISILTYIMVHCLVV